ncbi:leukocidin family pore-forming toxin [Staphylococcus aureus]
MYGYTSGGHFMITRGRLTGNITKRSHFSATIIYQQPSSRPLLDPSP